MTLMARLTLTVAARICVLTIIAGPGVAWAQSISQQRELELTAAIEQAASQYGVQSKELIEPLTALSLYYEEAGDYGIADATIERLLQVIRANYGLYSLDQAPSIRRLIMHAQERGNPIAAWNLEQDLLRLAARNRDDIRTARIFREIGDRRFEILKRYSAGEPTPEIQLGCYYDNSKEYLKAARRGSRPIYSTPGLDNGGNCAAGSRTVAKRALVAEAHGFYMAAINIYRENDLDLEESGELHDLLTDVVRSSYLYSAIDFGRSSLLYLRDSEPEDSLARVEAMVQLADWDLMYAPDLGTKYRDSAMEGYKEAFDLAQEQDFPQASIDALFSPDVPVTLPSFLPNRLVSEETATSRGHIDIQFVVTDRGTSDYIDVLDTTSANVPREVERDLINEIKYGHFRPKIVNGEPADSGPFVIHYYLND